MTTGQIILTGITVILIPAVIAEVRWRNRTIDRLTKIESLLGFLQTYLLKDAVLKFHSPDPRHAKTDKIIEKLVEGKELEPEELDALVDKIKAEAACADDKKRRLEATTTLVLMDEFLEAVIGKRYTAFSEYE